MKTIVRMENISKSYGNHMVLDHFSLNIHEGEMVALVGKSGCGKTTVLNLIGLIENPTAGSLELFGQPAPAVSKRQAEKIIRNEISYLFQNFALVEHLSVQKNLELALVYSGLSKAKKKKAILESLETVDLVPFLTQPVYTLSGGQQQKVALARTMLKKGDLILADEPTGALDAASRDEVLTLLTGLNKKGKTIVIVTHDPAVASHCTRVIHLEEPDDPLSDPDEMDNNLLL